MSEVRPIIFDFKMGKPQSKEENESGQQLVSIIENQNSHSELHEDHSFKLSLLLGFVIFIMIVVIIKIIRNIIRKDAERAARVTCKLTEVV